MIDIHVLLIYLFDIINPKITIRTKYDKYEQNTNKKSGKIRKIIYSFLFSKSFFRKSNLDIFKNVRFRNSQKSFGKHGKSSCW